MNVQEHALAVTLELRIAELRGYVRWYKATDPWLRSIMEDIEREHRAELGVLLRLKQRAARLSRAAQQPAGVDYHTWQAAG